MKKIILTLIIVLVSIGSFIVWKNQRINTKDNDAVKAAVVKIETFIDVRTDQEWKAGHLDGALHFDLAKIQQGQLPDLPKDAPIALYCRSGRRAGEALAILQKNGFTNVRNAGGYDDLQTQGKKICLGTQETCN